MPPWEEDQPEFVEDIKVGDGERDLDKGKRQIPSELQGQLSLSSGQGQLRMTYILLNVLLTCSNGALAKLHAHLSSSIVHTSPSSIPLYRRSTRSAHRAETAISHSRRVRTRRIPLSIGGCRVPMKSCCSTGGGRAALADGWRRVPDIAPIRGYALSLRIRRRICARARGLWGFGRWVGWVGRFWVLERWRRAGVHIRWLCHSDELCDLIRLSTRTLFPILSGLYVNGDVLYAVERCVLNVVTRVDGR